MSFTEHLTVGWNQASSFVSTHVPSFIRDRRMDSKLVIGISASIAAVITASALHRFIQIQVLHAYIMQGLEIAHAVFCQRAQSDGTPMVSYKFPIIGSTREYRKDPRAFLEKYEAKYGPVYRAHLFGRVRKKTIKVPVAALKFGAKLKIDLHSRLGSICARSVFEQQFQFRKGLQWCKSWFSLISLGSCLTLSSDFRCAPCCRYLR